MSIKIIDEVWKKHHITPTEKLVLLAIADKCGHCGHGWVSYSTLVKMTELSERTVKRTIQKLLTDDHLRVSTFKHKNLANIYTLMSDQCRGDTAHTLRCANCNLQGVSPRHPYPFLDPSLAIAQNSGKEQEFQKRGEQYLTPGFLEAAMNGKHEKAG
jgi:hypothetical protein